MGNAIGIDKPKLNSTLVESYDKQDKGDERSGDTSKVAQTGDKGEVKNNYRWNVDDAANQDAMDNKGSNRFSEHMSKQRELRKDFATAVSSDAVSNRVGSSDFSREKTLAEQRRFLPVFAVRNEFLSIIRCVSESSRINLFIWRS